MFRNLKFDPIPCRTSFEIYDMDLSIVNAVRRIIQTDILTVGILGEPAEETTVMIDENNGPLHNEFLAHRVGLVPIHFPEEEVLAYEDGMLHVELDVTHDGSGIREVTTHDFTVFLQDKQLPPKEAIKYFPADHVTKSAVLITKLRTGEKLKLKATAIKASGRKHAAFSPVSLCAFFYMQDEGAIAQLEAKGPADILTKERTYMKNEFGDPSAYVFSVESENGMSASYLIAEGFQVLMSKLDAARTHFIQRSDEDETSLIRIAQYKETENTFDITFKNEDDTLGSFMQSLMHNDYVRRKLELNDKGLTYAGYYCPHPLDPTMVVRLSFTTETTIKECEEFIKTALQKMHNHLNDISNEWKTFALASKLGKKE